MHLSSAAPGRPGHLLPGATPVLACRGMLSISLSSARRFRLSLVLIATAAVPSVVLASQGVPNEAALRRAFEGTAVVLRIDMPGTSDGVDVRAAQLDQKQYADRLTRYGVALQAGQRATVSLIKVKKDLVEFQLNGGGYGTVGDETSTSVDMPDVPKSNREKDLEQRVKIEGDARRKKDLQRELDDVRTAREGENRRIAVQRSIAEDGKRRVIAARRLEGGSRFNIRYASVVPANVSAEDLIAALSAFVDFGAADAPAPPRPVGAVRKGQLRADVERSLGAPVETSERREGALRVVSLVFVRANERITAEFVEDVLIRYTIVGR